MKPTHYVRIEGVNLDHFVYDTADLSTVRGGGLMLLKAITKAEAYLRDAIGHNRVRALSTGASSGFFALELPDDPATPSAQKLVEGLRVMLATDGSLSQATFVVSLVPYSGNFARDRETLLALNRHQQMNRPSLAVPVWNTNAATPPCDFDGLRPGTDDEWRPPRIPGQAAEEVAASPSAKLRRQFGRDQRQEFYAGETKGIYELPQPGAFTQDFEELAGAPFPNVPDGLRGKIAVIYLDGNKFGALQRTRCQDPNPQQHFDDCVKLFRRTMLAGLLRHIDAHTGKEWWSRSHNRRIETLLWGGDEIIWVVPAWKGWEVLQFFFEHSADWDVSLPGDGGAEQKFQLTHAAGLVFAHHDAPIQRLRKLAENLANKVKDGLKEPYSPAANRFDYEVLESFDHIGPDFDAYRKTRLAHRAHDALVDVSLPGAGMGTLATALRALNFPPTSSAPGAAAWLPLPTRQIHLWFEKWRGTSPPPDRAALAETISKDADLKLHQQRLLAFADTTGDGALWYHLASLWDYVARVPAPTTNSPSRP